MTGVFERITKSRMAPGPLLAIMLAAVVAAGMVFAPPAYAAQDAGGLEGESIGGVRATSRSADDMLKTGLVVKGKSDGRAKIQIVGGETSGARVKALPEVNDEVVRFYTVDNAGTDGAKAATFTILVKDHFSIVDIESGRKTPIDLKLKVTTRGSVLGQYHETVGFGRSMYQQTADSFGGQAGDYQEKTCGQVYVGGNSVNVDWANARQVQMDYSFLEAGTDNPIVITGNLWFRDSSMDPGEGFTVYGGKGANIVNTMPVTNPEYRNSDAYHNMVRDKGVTWSKAYGNLDSGQQWHTLPGTNVYELVDPDNEGYFGYLGAVSRVTIGGKEYGHMEGIESDPESDDVFNNTTSLLNAAGNNKFFNKSGGDGVLSTTAQDSWDQRALWWSAAVYRTYNNQPLTFRAQLYATVKEGYPKNNDWASQDTSLSKALLAWDKDKEGPWDDRHAMRHATNTFDVLTSVLPPANSKSSDQKAPLQDGDQVTFAIEQPEATWGQGTYVSHSAMKITDKLSSQLSYVNGSGKVAYTSPSGQTVDVTAQAGKFSYNQGTNTLAFDFDRDYLEHDGSGNARAAMPYAGGTYKVSFTCKAHDVVVEQEENEATTQWNDNPNYTRTTPKVPVTYEPKAELDIAKTVNFENPVGGTATYQIKVSSVKGNAREVRVVDDSLPEGFAVVEGSATVAGGTNPQVRAQGKSVTATMDLLAEGQSATVTFQVVCPESHNGKEVFNTASATCANPAPGKEKVTATDGIWINSAKLDVLKRADSFEYRVGDTVTYTVSLTNTAPDGTIAKNVVLTDNDLPERVQIDPSTIKVEGVPATVAYPLDGNGKHKEEKRDNKHTLSPQGNGFVLTVPYLPAGKLVTITYQATATADSNGEESFNSAVATLDNPLPGHEQATSSDGVWTNDAVLHLTKDVDEYETQVGDTVRYTVKVLNMASGTIGKNLVIDDLTLPDGLQLVEDSVKVEGIPATVTYPIDGNGEHKEEQREGGHNVVTVSGGGEAAESPNSFTVKAPYLPAGNEVTVTYDCVPTEDINGDEIVNTARTYCDNMLDGKGAEDDALIWVNTPHLTIDKTVEQRGKYNVGDTVTYTIKVENAQVGTFARNIEVADAFALPGMKLVRSSIYVFDESHQQITDGVKLLQRRDSADWAAETNSNLVCFAGGYGKWEDRVEAVQEAWNPLSETEEQTLFVEFQAVVQDADLAGQILQNTATASARGDEEGRGSAEPVDDTADIMFPKQVGDLVTPHKSSDPANGTKVAADDTIAYTIELANTGNETAPFTLVRDYIPEGTVYVDGSVSEGGAYVAADAEGNVTGRAYVEWLVRDIEPNASVPVSFSVTVAEEHPTQIHNVAYHTKIDREVEPGSPSNPEPKKPSNEIDHPTGNTPAPGYVDVVKSSNPLPGTVERGSTIAYTLTVTNTGGQDVADVAVFDAIPDHTTYASHEPVHNATLSADSRAMGWNIAALAAGESVQLKFSVTVDEAAPDDAKIDNQASWDWFSPGVPAEPLTNLTNITRHAVDPGDPPAPEPEDPPAPEPEDPPVPVTEDQDPAAVEVVKSSVPDPGTQVGPGESITYTLTVSNNGGSDAEGVAVYDAIPEHTVFDRAPNVHRATTVREGQTVKGMGWLVERLAPGETTTLEFTVKVADGVEAGIEVANMASFEPGKTDPPAEPLPTPTNEVRHPVKVGDPSLPNIDKSLESFDGQTAVYRITVSSTNEAPVAAGFQVADIASNLTYVSHTPDSVTYRDHPAAAGKTAADCAGIYVLPRIEAGQTFQIEATYKVIDPARGIINHVRPGSDEGSELRKFRVASAEDLSPVSGPVKVGQTLTYIVELANTGQSVIDGRTVVDYPGPGLEISEVAALDGTASVNSDGNGVWEPGAIQPGAQARMLVTAQVGAQAEGKVTNRATDGQRTVIATDPIPGDRAPEDPDPQDKAVSNPGNSPSPVSGQRAGLSGKTGDLLLPVLLGAMALVLAGGAAVRFALFRRR